MTEPTQPERINHYTWLDAHFVEFLAAAFANQPDTIRSSSDAESYRGMIVAHGDKGTSYRDIWEKAGIPYDHAMAIYLLSYIYPWSRTVRDGDQCESFVAPGAWVINKYHELKMFMEPSMQPQRGTERVPGDWNWPGFKKPWSPLTVPKDLRNVWLACKDGSVIAGYASTMGPSVQWHDVVLNSVMPTDEVLAWSEMTTPIHPTRPGMMT